MCETMTAEVTVKMFVRDSFSATGETVSCGDNKTYQARNFFLGKSVDVQDIKQSMEQMKDWILHKCKAPLVAGSASDTRGKLQNVVTPDSIPQFMIPGQSTEIIRKNSGERNSESPNNIAQSHSWYNLQSSPVHSRSAPLTPSASMVCKKTSEQNSSESCDYISELQATNADPQSMIALSLPHFRIQTPFGLTTVSQNPHTRRKESLFHVLQNNHELTDSRPSRKQLRKKCHSLDEATAFKIPSSVPGTPNLEIRSRSRNSSSSLPRRRRDVSYVAAPLGVVGSSSSLEAHSANESRESPHISSPSTPEMPTRTACAQPSSDRVNYFRRRTSLALARTSAECSVCNKAAYTSDDSSDENFRTNNYSKISRRRSSSSEQCGSICHSCILDRLQVRLMAELGELKLSIEYCSERKQLKVLLIRAENLGGRMKTDDNMSTFAKVCLLPDKHHKGVTKVVKHTSDPVFDETMTFNGIDTCSLKELTLRVKIMQKTHNLKSERLLGQVMIDLGSVDLTKEVRMWRDLQAKDENDVLGKLDVTVRFEPKEERLCVTVNNAKRLRNHPVTGPPDAYVKVTVRQPGRSQMKKSTIIRKNAINPVFGEMFIFQISPKIEHLNYAAVTMTVYDHTKLRSDVAIGQVRLGHRSTEECEFEHWNQVLQHPGQDYTWVHTLMDPKEDKQMK